MPSRHLITVFLCAAMAAPALAQRYSDLYGRVLDTSGGGIGSASISVVNEDSGFRRTSASDPDGVYSVGSLEPGSYKITVRKEGFRSAVRFNVALAPAVSTRADFTLPVGNISESITVRGTAPMLDRQNASAGGGFEREEIERLPLNGGGVLGLLDLIPGTNLTPATRGEAGQFTTDGQRPNANYFTVDGVSANNGITAGGLPAQSSGGTLPAVSAFGSLDSLISLEAVREVRVQTSSSIAEFGRLPGASVALTSQSGTNEFHGATYLRGRNELLNANDWFANRGGFARSQSRLYDIAQTFGGPLHRNRTFFFLSYEHMALRQPFVWEQPVPAVPAGQRFADWAQPLLNLCPAANAGIFSSGLGVWTGRGGRPARLDTGGARFDQALGARVSLFARFNDSPSTNAWGSIDVNRLDLRARSLTAGVTARATSGLTLDFRVNESESTAHSVWLENATQAAPSCSLQSLLPAFTGAVGNCGYLMRFSLAGVAQLESGREGDRKQRQFQSVSSATWRRGAHRITLGADYRAITAVRRDSAGTISIIADQISDLADSRYPWVSIGAPINQTASLPEPSLWIEDTWQISRRLTAAAGLRWEYSPSPNTAGPSFFFNPAENGFALYNDARPVWTASRRDFAPRLGLAYRLTADGRDVLRAGGGVYYDSSMSIATDVLNGGPLNISQYGSGRNGIFSSVLSYGFAPDLKLPEIRQWNVAVEHATGERGVLSLGYVGSSGRGLIRRELGGPGSSQTALIALTTNRGRSDYHSLQAQFRRQLSRGLEAQAGYTWAHSIDNDSSDAFLVWAGNGAGAAADRGNSDFDLRHAVSGSLDYRLPAPDGRWGRALRGWSAAAVWRARPGFPINVQASPEYRGIALINAFRPGYLAGEKLWTTDVNSPGGRGLNAAAFTALPAGVQGNLGRNAIAGFGMWQVDLALSRDFRLTDRAALQFRASAFNALNHANFADPVKYLDSPLFGQSASLLNMMLGTGSPGSGLAPMLQAGAPRAVELALRLRF